MSHHVLTNKCRSCQITTAAVSEVQLADGSRSFTAWREFINGPAPDEWCCPLCPHHVCHLSLASDNHTRRARYEHGADGGRRCCFALMNDVHPPAARSTAWTFPSARHDRVRKANYRFQRRCLTGITSLRLGSVARGPDYWVQPYGGLQTGFTAYWRV